MKASLKHVRSRASVFPHELLTECDSALMLFAAAFYGRNDCVWVEAAGLRDVTCVDLDGPQLERMSEIYPDDWRFVCADAYRYRPTRTFDLVCVDTFSGAESHQALAVLEHWCGFAEKFVLVTLIEGSEPRLPAGWRADLVRRSDYAGGCYWLVLERE